MFVGYVDIFFYNPGITLAVWATIIIVRDDLVVSVAKYSFATLALFGVIQGDAVANWACYKFRLEKAILANPLIIYNDKLRLIIMALLLLLFDLFTSLLHIIFRFSNFHSGFVYIMQSNQSKDEISIQRFKQTVSKSEIKQFMRAYQLKQVAIQELAKIYSRHIFTQHFTSTMKSAICLIVLPSLTNIYYAIRSHSVLAGVMPFAVPLICLANYIYFLNKEMQKFSLTSSPDAALARNQYEIIYQYSYFDRQKNNLIEKLQNYRKDNEQNSVKRKDLI